MSRLRDAAENYLVMRRALGFKLTSWGRHLMGFIDYCEAHHADHITTEVALAWAMQTSRGSSDEVYWSRRFMVVRIFARHLKTLDPATEVPPADVLPHHYRRIAPYLYSPEEIAALMSVAGRLTPALRAATWQTLIGLLAVTGMRKGEVCDLDRDQVDVDTGVLVVAASKFGKSRQVFLHASTIAALRDYERRRDYWCPTPRAPSFFVSTRGTRLDAHNITHTFAELVDAAGIQAPPGRRRPRLHDLRHSFTVATLLDWYRDGGDVQAPAAVVHLARACRPEVDVLVSAGSAAAAGAGRGSSRARVRGPAMSPLAPILQGFFTDKLLRQRQASPHTIAAYRDTCRLLLDFAWNTTGIAPTRLDLCDLDAPLIGAFLHHLETQRANTVATRNTRLAAIHSLFRYAALRAPDHAAQISRVLAIPPKRCDRAIVCFLTASEIDALLAAPDRTTWLGRRDHALLLLACQTGLRVSELIGLTCGDIHLGTGPHVRCHGKGRKDRATPLTSHTAKVLRVWLAERDEAPAAPLFPARAGHRLSRDAVERLVAKHATTTASRCATIAAKNVTPHTLRHSAVMALLHAGVDTSVIALWLGHEDPDSTQAYLHADMTIKERALARVQPHGTKPGRYRAPDTLLAFLDNL